MTPRRLTRLAELVALNVTAIQVRITATEDHMNAICPDGYPAGGSSVRGGATSTVTEAAVLARARVAADHATLEATLRAIADLCGRVVNVCDRYPGVGHDQVTRYQQHRCTGGMGEPGHLEWGRPECENIVGAHTTSGLCDQCRARRNRWQRQNQRQGA